MFVPFISIPVQTSSDRIRDEDITQALTLPAGSGDPGCIEEWACPGSRFLRLPLPESTQKLPIQLVLQTQCQTAAPPEPAAHRQPFPPS